MQEINQALMRPQSPWREWLKISILLAMSIYFAMLLVSGSINFYMNQRFQWLVVLAMVLFGGLGVWNARLLFFAKPIQHRLDDQLNIDHTGHQHTQITWGAILTVCIPLALAIMIPASPLGASAVTGGVSMSNVGVANAGTFKQSSTDRNILDWLREFNRVDNAASFNGESADLLGFVYREPYMTDNQFMIARFTLSCCVADAFAIGIPVELDNATQYETGKWYQIQGTFQSGTFGDVTVPILRPTQLTPAEIPASPYLYP